MHQKRMKEHGGTSGSFFMKEELVSVVVRHNRADEEECLPTNDVSSAKFNKQQCEESSAQTPHYANRSVDACTLEREGKNLTTASELLHSSPTPGEEPNKPLHRVEVAKQGQSQIR